MSKLCASAAILLASISGKTELTKNNLVQALSAREPSQHHVEGSSPMHLSPHPQ